MESTRARRMMKKKSGKSKGLVEKSTRSRDKGTYRLNPLQTELRKSSPNSLYGEQYYATCFYRFREQVLVDAWPELESAAKKHGLYLTLHRDDKFYIAIKTTPWTRNPGIFDMAKEFLEVLASTNVPPSVAIQILNGDVHHEYIMVGHEEGGLCLKHGITMEQFDKRWKRFTHILQICDGEDSNIGSIFDEAVEFIDHIEQTGGKVLARSFEGIRSRSATLVLAHLMLRKSSTLLEAWNSLKQVHREHNPTKGLLRSCSIWIRNCMVEVQCSGNSGKQ